MIALRRAAVALTLLAVAAAAAAGAAAGDGGPSPGLSFGTAGVLGPGGQLRYVTIPTDRGTIVEAVRVHDGNVMRWIELRGPMLGIPYVTSDGTGGGLSHDVRTLVLSSYPTFPGPGSSTRFAVLDTRSFRITHRIVLRGAYSYDALSPDASTMYLIQYTSSNDVNRYRVRAYDIGRGRLVPGAVVDRREPAEAMQGSPLTRATSAEGRWVYTLYLRPAGTWFVHALDTIHRRAFCVDLPWHTPQGISHVTMSVRAGRLVISQRNARDLATVDTRTLAVEELRAPAG